MRRVNQPVATHMQRSDRLLHASQSSRRTHESAWQALDNHRRACDFVHLCCCSEEDLLESCAASRGLFVPCVECDDGVRFHLCYPQKLDPTNVNSSIEQHQCDSIHAHKCHCNPPKIYFTLCLFFSRLLLCCFELSVWSHQLGTRIAHTLELSMHAAVPVVSFRNASPPSRPPSGKLLNHAYVSCITERRRRRVCDEP